VSFPGGDEALATIWNQHRETMFARVDTIALALADGTKRGQARDAAHQLAGTVGTFGFPRASELARALERMLADGDDDRATMGQMVAELRADLDDPPFIVKTAEPVASDETPKAAPLPLILLAAPDARDAERLRIEASRRGLSVGHVGHLEQVLARAERDHPDVIVLDLGEQPAQAAGLLSDLAERHPEVPVLVVANSHDFEDRLVVARNGVAGLIDGACTPVEVMDQVALALQRKAIVGARVLMVGAAPEAREVVEAAGLEVETTDDPNGLWDELQRVSPALVVLGADIPEISGYELCRVLRNAPRWSFVPIVMLAEGPEAAEQVFAAGADDCVHAAAVPTELAVRVRSHLERFRVHQALAETDALTGLQNRRTASAAISALIRMAERLGKPFCLVQLDIDHFKRVNDVHGHIVGDAVLRRLSDILRRRFRDEDVVARWGGEEFILGLFSLDREGGIDRISEILNRFRAEEFEGDRETFSVSFSAGVAEYPTDGVDLEGLYVAADEALYAAKAAGRDQVTGAGATQSTQQIDVAIVEDEDAASELMSHMLTERGQRCWRFSNGAGAASLLSGEEPKVRARVILLDLNMPAINGMELLSLLKRDGVLRRSNVIVVTATDDEEMRSRSRALGAIDYLVKPVHPDALAVAVDRALGRTT
jgi:diguanylate cyclase (GGDEF)-like protein